jgi:FKBP-type peptidyl-prolyl cis-trans isomerase
MSALLFAAILHLSGQTPPVAAATPTPKVAIVDMTAGKGDGVQFGDTVTLDYTGKLTDGKKFDSSKNPGGKPFTVMVGVGKVIKGWDQGLIGMKVGGVRKLTIPYQLAYGEEGSPPDIPPKATLVFTVALYKIDHTMNQIKVEITTAGHGPGLEVGQLGKMIYTAKLATGKVLVSKEQMHEPARVVLGATPMIAGLALGIYGMKAGETRTVTVPPDLAFGEKGPESVGNNQTIIFEITMLGIENPQDESGGPEKRK